ncbi:hypothetical protein ENSA5_53880 [Enhygromyxa salina]|uniref:Thioredoxin domain-containing protein n=1 Tax=Enhygromyxa salina TaxID=215803 RepID=A0A2S9XFH9_9BACT|nr:hypothetical protein [Enhygromyxa salina]PRP91628.1 hypothetical protein ENSA5_53880 [Enhygromyxa salina]
MNFQRLVSLTPLAALALCFACENPDPDPLASDAETGAEGDSDSDGDGDDESDTGTDEGVDPDDPDGDGLTNAEEDELGTDPNKADSDDDTYWDSWEVTEGTDPLDYESRIYVGFWPYNPNKDELEQGTWATASHALGSQFPRASFLDQHGDTVEIYDFANFTDNPTNSPTFFVMDVAAQWCGPCHNAADWISGVDSPSTASLQEAYPTVREKVQEGRVFWVTYMVQDAQGDAPTLADAETWASMHPDDKIPIFVDDTQQVLDRYGSGQFPFFFLVDPVMAIEFWAYAGANADPFFPLSLVDEYL